MDPDRVISAVAGTVAFVVAGHAIKTRRIVFGEDGDDHQVWLYGWRAVVIGCLALAAGLLLMASAFGLIHLDNA